MSSCAFPLAILNFSGMELLLVLLILLLLFGGKRLPELAKGLGQSIREFKKATNEEADHTPADSDAAKPSPPGKPGDGKPSTGAN